ncbi:hypothetical protein L9F63_019994 [Diploptera punctata]|uniref:DUF229 domain containing protein n=1 Tax=Diploptera punctata TaxID=6984 RepID=A0AAD7ZTF7_DIPPU|nr:hypothetical protein L9F63_019994 [Diploptera punctata]
MRLHRNPLRVRGGMVVAIVITLMVIFISYIILQGTMTVGRLLQAVTHQNPDSIFEIDSYLVWSPKCQIPNVNPFHESIRRFIVGAESIICSKKPPLSNTLTHDDKVFLKIDADSILNYTSDPNHLSCCYSVVTRVNTPDWKIYNKTADNYYNVSECLDFNQKVYLSSEKEYVLVKCKDKSNNKEVYKNMHAVVQVKQEVKDKIEKVGTNDKTRLNILVLGLDSISRLNLLRTMPKTVAHLRRKGWLELQGYNKVGENTLPNLSAIFMGLNEEQLKDACWKTRHKKFDNCPLIWNNFSDLSYVTAYLEDTPTQSTFNFHKTGFVKPPTDFYMRPMMLAAEQLLPVKSRDFLNVCLGPTPTTEHILKYMTDFATVFKRALYFLVAWINNFSHNDSATPATMDKRILQFFEQLEDTGALNSTLVIFLSDHGMRWGSIRSTSVGWLEERLPFIYFWIPEWFRNAYPDSYANFITNKNRLTSPYDVHMTLRDVFQRSIQGNSSKIVKGCTGCPKCVSLFSEVPTERSCEDAGITPNWCTCTKYRIIPTKGKIVTQIANFVVSEINSKIYNLSNGTNVCAELAFHKVIQLKRQAASYHDDYIIVFETLPGAAVFEATVGKQGKKQDELTFQLKGGISRINRYTNQTECIDDAELKLFCFCA